MCQPIYIVDSNSIRAQTEYWAPSINTRFLENVYLIMMVVFFPENYAVLILRGLFQAHD
jgi:hypothetical protein